MSAIKKRLEDRVATLEQEVAALKAQMDARKKSNKDWLNAVVGSFANDPAFEEAMRLGREWRESFRPKPRKRQKAK